MTGQVITGLITFPSVLLLALLVQRLRPSGAHRAPRIAASPVSPYPDSEAAGRAWCPECDRSEAHALHTDGSRTCWICHHTTPEGS